MRSRCSTTTSSRGIGRRFLDVEELRCALEEALRIESLHSRDDTMRRQHGQCRAVQVEKSHGQLFVRRVGGIASLRAHFVAVGQCRLIAMMPVRNDELLAVHRFLNV
jgi:hypothetical protein